MQNTKYKKTRRKNKTQILKEEIDKLISDTEVSKDAKVQALASCYVAEMFKLMIYKIDNDNI